MEQKNDFKEYMSNFKELEDRKKDFVMAYVIGYLISMERVDILDNAFELIEK